MPRKLVYLVSEDWYFISHRLPMARAARDAGYEVHVATRVVACGEQIEREGFVLHPIPWRRGSINPLPILATARAVRRLYREIKPDIAHHVAFAPAVLGSLAALGLPMRKLNALAGLGFVFTSGTAKARLLRPFARHVLKFLLTRPGTTVLVQNPDDRAMVSRLGIADAHIALIPGSGVDTDVLTPLPEPEGTLVVTAPVRELAFEDIADPDFIFRRSDRFARLFAQSAALPAITCAVVHPCDRDSLEGALEAAARGMIVPTLVGPEAKIRAAAAACGADLANVAIVATEHSHAAAATATAMARDGKVESLMKGKQVSKAI